MLLDPNLVTTPGYLIQSSEPIHVTQFADKVWIEYSGFASFWSSNKQKHN